MFNVLSCEPKDSSGYLQQRGSPDGASSRAESPPASCRRHIVSHHVGNNFEKTSIPKCTIDQNYNQLARQYIGYSNNQLPTTSPPCYPGTASISSNRNSGLFSETVQSQHEKDQNFTSCVER